MAGKENEPLSSSRPGPRHCPIKHLAAKSRHQHVANDQVESALHNFAKTFNAALDRSHIKKSGDQIIVEHLSKIVAIFQEQDPVHRPRRVPGNLNVESLNLRRIGLSQPHNPKGISKTDTLAANLRAVSTPVRVSKVACLTT